MRQFLFISLVFGLVLGGCSSGATNSVAVTPTSPIPTTNIEMQPIVVEVVEPVEEVSTRAFEDIDIEFLGVRWETDMYDSVLNQTLSAPEGFIFCMIDLLVSTELEKLYLEDLNPALVDTKTGMQVQHGTILEPNSWSRVPTATRETPAEGVIIIYFHDRIMDADDLHMTFYYQGKLHNIDIFETGGKI